MKADRYLFDGSHPCALRKLPCDSKDDHVKKEDILAKTAENLEKMTALQDAFYADGREGLVIILQALDAAGKDSTVKHVMGGLNPQGVQVTSFKQPTSEELHHDFLWRVNKALPPRGSIAIFNRSYYEDVLVQVHDLQKTYQMAPRVLEDSKKDFFEKRYRQIRSYEEYLYENSYRVVKIFLHVSKDEQKKRFLERIDRPEKNWKFSCSDLKERPRIPGAFGRCKGRTAELQGSAGTGIMPNAAGWMFPRQAAKGGAHFAADPRITNHARHGRRRHGNLCHECLPCRGPQPGTV